MLNFVEVYFIQSKFAFRNCLLFFLTIFVISSITSTHWDQDESAYAGMAERMIQTGNWVIPDFEWSQIHRKTPLLYWTISICYSLFGINTFSLRLPSILAALGTISLVYFIAIQYAEKRKAIYAMLIAGNSFLILFLARVALTDGLLLFFFCLLGYATIRQIKEPTWYWPLLIYGALALGLLTKGPPLLLFAGFWGILLLLFFPERKKLISLHPWLWGPLALVPIVVWGYLTIQQDNGKLLEWMLEFYIKKRINDSVLGQTAPPGTHSIIIALSFLPYLFLLPNAIANTKSKIKQRDPLTILLILWLIVAWLPYEFSPSKLPSYTVAAHIPLAIFFAANGSYAEHNRRWNFSISILNFFLAAALAVAPLLLSIPLNGKILISLFGLSYLIIFLFFVLSKNKNIVYIVATGMVLQILATLFFFPGFDSTKINTQEVAKKIQEAPHSLVVVANDEGKPPSLPLYLYRNQYELCFSFYVKDWVEVYYTTPKATLVLKENQLNTLLPHIDRPKIDTIPSYFLETNSWKNYYLVKNQHYQASTIDTLPAPNKVLSISEHEQNLKSIKSDDFLHSIKQKASERSVTFDEMIHLDAVYLFEHQRDVNLIESKIRHYPQWIQFVERQNGNSSLEQKVHEEASRIHEKQNIQ